MPANSDRLIEYGRRCAWERALNDYDRVIRITTISRYEPPSIGTWESAATGRKNGLGEILKDLAEAGFIDETDLDSSSVTGKILADLARERLMVRREVRSR